jgi:hypothetical protein
MAVLQQRPLVVDDVASPRLATASRLIVALSKSRGFESEKFLPIMRRLATEPALRSAAVDVSAAVSERAITRTIRSIFALQQ